MNAKLGGTNWVINMKEAFGATLKVMHNNNDNVMFMGAMPALHRRCSLSP